MGAASQQGTLVNSSGHLVLPHLGLAFVLMLKPFFPELVMSTDLLSFEHPLVLLFCFWAYRKTKMTALVEKGRTLYSGAQYVARWTPCFFSAPEPKAQVHYCDHASSVVRPSVVRRR